MAPIHPQKDFLLPLSEKSAFDSSSQLHRHAQPQQKSRMTSARKLCIALLVGGLVVVGLAHSDAAPENVCSIENGESCIDVTSQQDQSALSRLIQSASPEALHNFLHSVTGYQHGVFDSDVAAAEAVLKIDPSLSTSVAQLQRRQQNGTSTTDSVLPPASPTTTSPTSDVTTPISTQDTTTPPTTPSTPTTTTPITTPPSSIQDTTTTDIATPSTTTQNTSPTTTTPSSTQETTQETTTQTSTRTSNTSPTGTTTTTRPDTTTTNGGQTTATRRPTTSLKTNIVTSTLPGGALTTMTTVAVVTADGATDASPTDSSNPSLQNGRAGHSYSKSLLEVVIGAVAVGGVMML